MNVYDFDETIFEGDCEERFFRYLSTFKGFRFTRIKFRFFEILSKNLKFMSRTTARQIQYTFLKRIDKIDDFVEEYWNTVEKYMKPWYLKVKKDDDIIASGTPDFLIRPMVLRLGLTGLVATNMDKRTGKITGFFAVGRYKLEYFEKKFNSDEIDNFYSDAYSDHFLADKAKHAYYIYGKNHDQMTDWNEYFQNHSKK